MEEVKIEDSYEETVLEEIKSENLDSVEYDTRTVKMIEKVSEHELVEMINKNEVKKESLNT